MENEYEGLSPHESRMRFVGDMARAKKIAQENIKTLFAAAGVLRTVAREDLAVSLEEMATATMTSLAKEVPELERALHKLIDHMEESE